jgi:uncharacterized protein (TIRG00374 family)
MRMPRDFREDAPQGRRFGRAAKLVVGLGLSAAFLYAMLRTVPLDKVAAALASAQPRWIFAALASLAFGYFLKTYRWTIMLRSLGSTVRVSQAATPFMGGIAFNNVLPFRSGDVIRVLAFQRFTGIPASGQIGTLVLERLLDLFVLMAILFATLSYADAAILDEALLAGLQLAALAVAAAILVFIAAPGLIRLVVRALEARVPKLRPAGEAFLRLSDAVATLSRPRFILGVTFLSIVAWLAEGGAFYCVGRALGVASSAEAALLALSVGTLSTIIPSSPGYVGTFHYFTARALAGFGASEIGAAAYAILIHAILWLSTTATGFLLLALSGLKRALPPIAKTESRIP